VSWFTGAVLGLLQGITEFLPVSSSGHLVLAQALWGLGEPDLLFDVVVHVGTLLAVAVVFRSELWSLWRGLMGRDPAGRRLLGLVILGSIPTAMIGLAAKDWFESLFASPAAVGLALLATGGLLMVTRWAPAGRRGLEQMGWGRAVLVGLAQGLAITPGLSRSGTTIAVGLLLGLERRLAARFSFVLSVPAIVGALVLELADLPAGREVALGPLVAGGVVAAVSGYLALRLLLSLVQHGRLHWFAWYCWALGLAALAGWGLG